MIETAVVAALLADATVAGLVGEGIYPMAVPQGAPVPAIVYQRIFTGPLHTLVGDEGSDDVRLQLSCWAPSYAVAKALAAAARAALTAAASLSLRTTGAIDYRDEETRHYGVILDVNLWQRGP